MSEQKSLKSVFMNGILQENPTFRLLLGMCPTLAISTAVNQGIGMGLATTFVLVFSNLVISLSSQHHPRKGAHSLLRGGHRDVRDHRRPGDEGVPPALSQSLGLYIPLIVVNCIIFARAESFAFKNPPMRALADGLGMGLGFTLAITLLSAVREVIGSGTFLGMQVMPASYHPMAIVIRPPGGFIMLGLLLLVVNATVKVIAKRKEAKAKEEIA
jgi:electron transport complex protein RnfE